MTIFRYPGGKAKKSIKNKIISFFPEDFTYYREPFVGGGSIFFSIDKSKKRWINDKDNDLISVYLELKNNSKEFIEKCQEIKVHSKNEELPPPIYNQRLKNKFNELVSGENTALKFFFINRTVWGGRVNYNLKSRLYFSNPKGWNIINTDKLHKAAESLQNTTITSTSYQKLLLDPCFNGNCLIYCDPPYQKNTELSETSQLYKHNFTQNDHIELAETVKYSPHKVCLSYDDNEFIRNLYKSFNIFDFETVYSGTSSAKSDKSRFNKKKEGKELVITNF